MWYPAKGGGSRSFFTLTTKENHASLYGLDHMWRWAFMIPERRKKKIYDNTLKQKMKLPQILNFPRGRSRPQRCYKRSRWLPYVTQLSCFSFIITLDPVDHFDRKLKNSSLMTNWLYRQKGHMEKKPVSNFFFKKRRKLSWSIILRADKVRYQQYLASAAVPSGSPVRSGFAI